MSELDHILETTSTPEPTCSCAGWSIGFFFILLLFLIAAGLAIWWGIVYFRDRNTKGKTLELIKPNIEVTSNTALKGTWDSTTNTNDTVTLWVTTEPPIFKADGTITNSSIKPAVATGNDKTVSLSGLLGGLKYYAILVLTNPHVTSNYQTYIQLVFMDSVQPAATKTFEIDHILQVGKITIDTSGTTPTVAFKQNVSEPSALWEMNSDGKRIQNVSGDTTLCLYNNNGVLAVADCGASGPNSNNGFWTYNANGTGILANRWCLSNGLSGNTGMCMTLDPLLTGTPPSGSVTISSTTDAGDAWVNFLSTS